MRIDNHIWKVYSHNYDNKGYIAKWQSTKNINNNF